MTRRADRPVFGRVGFNLAAALVVSLVVLPGQPIRSQEVGEVVEVRIVEPDDARAAELPFPPGASLDLVPGERGTFLVFAGPAVGPGGAGPRLRLEAAINVTFDPRGTRLYVVQPRSGQLLEGSRNRFGVLAPSGITRSNIRPLGIRDPQGLAVDPLTGRLYILDAAGPTIIELQPDAQGELDPQNARREGRVAEIALTGIANPRGLGFDPTSGNLQVLTPANQRLTELTPDGQVVGVRDASGLGIQNPVAMVIGPSLDRTDDPFRTNLYVVTGRGARAAMHELALTDAAAGAGLPDDRAALVRQAVVAASLSSLVNTIDTSLFQPPSPDPAALAYLPDSGSLLVGDSEVNEMPIFTGDNLFETDLGGILLDTNTTISFSDEPAGLELDPGGRKMYVADDYKPPIIYVVDLGADGVYGTADDAVSSFLSGNFGSTDPEGVALAPGTLFIVDGVNSEVYRILPGPNGQFDGVDDEVFSFDTESLGVRDPEGVAFNPDNGHLYIVGRPADILAEVTISGALVQTIDISAAGGRKLAGLAYAPSSTSPGTPSIYIADRRVDNNTDPNENDGKIYEMTVPVIGCSSGADCDDGLFCNGTEACVGGVCQSGEAPCLGQQCDEASASCTPLECNTNGVCDPGESCVTCAADCISGDGSDGVTEFRSRVAASGDDVEEVAAGGRLSTTSKDLELLDEELRGLQIVSVRFIDVAVPPRATIHSAHVQFTADRNPINVGNGPITVEGIAEDNTAALDQAPVPSQRPLTSSAATWAEIPEWTRFSNGPAERTEDLAPIVQEIVDRPGWAAGNAMGFVLSGPAGTTRNADAYDGSRPKAPELVVTYIEEGVSAVPFCCGDGFCEGAEDSGNCAVDCAP